MHPRTLLVALLTISGAAVADPLKTLYDAHLWFQLRDRVAGAKTPSLYRGAVAYAFHDLKQAEEDLQRVLKAAPESQEAMEARGLLIGVAQMKGEYRRALSRIRAIQAIAPDSHDLDNGAAFFSALSGFRKQRVSRRRPATVRYSLKAGNLFIPVSVNGKAANYIFDTGANFSVLSESEARRLGLSVREAPGSHGTDAAGTSVPYRVALAGHVSVGDFEVRNVLFLVARDDQQPFVDLPAGSRGVLGIPVALAFETIRWNAEGRFEIGFDPPRAARRDANICFDGANPIVLAEYQRNSIGVFLDTGAMKSHLTPEFAEDFPDAIQGAARGVSTIRGIGGSAKIDAATLPKITLRIGGSDAVLNPAEVLLRNPEGRADRFHVWAGLDLFEHATQVMIDLRSMRFTVE